MQNNQKEQELLNEIEKLKKQIKTVKKNKRYGLIWEDKKEIFEKQSEISLPVLSEKKKDNYNDVISDINDSMNILIEGDNYHSLSVLSYTHKEKIDVIYIDPPYNTGNKDFIYNDVFVDKEDRFRHSKWLSFMNKRLKLAKELLNNNGVIFISIGDDELYQLKILCDEIFGEQNFLANVVRKQKETSNKGRFFSPSTDYILCYAKNIDLLEEFNDAEAQESSEYIKLFKYSDDRGKYNLVSLYMPSLDKRPNQRYFIECPDGTKVTTPFENKMFRWIPSTFKSKLEENRVVFLKTKTSPLIDESGKRSIWNVYTKIYLHERQEAGMKPLTFIDMPNSMGSKELIKLDIDFPFSKPKELIKHLISITNKNNNITVLDFFAGSGTTGQAVLELNNEDNGNRKFILCTNNGDEKSEHKICEDICYLRIKKVIEGYKNKKGKTIKALKGNLKYLKTDFINLDKITDDLRKKMVNRSTEILCLKEDCFSVVKNGKMIKIYQNKDIYLAILFDLFMFDEFKKDLLKLEHKKIKMYIFSPSKINFKQELEHLNLNLELEDIPDPILETYKKIFNF